MKYPSVLLFTSDKINFDALDLDLDCSVHISSDPAELSRFHDQTYHVLVTTSSDMWPIVNAHIVERMRNQWIDFPPTDPADFSRRVNHCFANYLINPIRERVRPVFSAFTTTFNTGDKIYRAYSSLLKQTMRDWEWVIVDDSPTDENFAFLRETLRIQTQRGSEPDPRVRLYRRAQNSGSIGNVKNEAVSLCRGKYLLELDHDDAIMPSLFEKAAEIMDKDNAVGFVYSDFYNIYEGEEGANFRYSDFISFGYGGYYCIYVPEDKQWRYVYITPNVNNITASALISLPNHPRIWRRTVMERAGNYSENLPICDDLEILIRTFALADVKVAKIHKPLYIQYMNAGGNNFSLIRNREINRIGPKYLSPMLYKQYRMHDMFEHKEDPAYLTNHSQIWKRGDDYEHKYANSVVNCDITKHVCVLGLRMLLTCIDDLINLPTTTELIVLDRERTPEELCSQLEVLGLTRARAYAMEDCSWDDLRRFAERLMCIPGNEMHIIGPPHTQTPWSFPTPERTITQYSTRHDVINNVIKEIERASYLEIGAERASYLEIGAERASYLEIGVERASYLEIGVEWGMTYRNVLSECKTGVDPSPKWDDGTVIRKTSDAFFADLDCDAKYDVIFIDGMHHAENVWRDIRNSLKHLSDSGVILIDDVLPQTEEEQWRVPRQNIKEDGILKYGGSPWVGDVWKAVNMFFQKVKPESHQFRVYSHPTNFRGILELRPGYCDEWIDRMPEEIPMEAFLVQEHTYAI